MSVRLPRSLVVVVTTLAVVVLAQPAALARDHRHDRLATANAVTLDASAPIVTFGHDVHLTGAVDPAASGESVEIRDAADAMITSATTDATGAFDVSVTPQATTTYHAHWQGLDSATVTVKVRAVVRVKLAAVRLFDTVRVTGHVTPVRAGEDVTVSLLHGGRAIVTRTPAQRATGRFSARFPVPLAGTYRARAVFSAADLARGVDQSGPRSTPLPTLSQGDRGEFVKLLKQRLRTLRYHVPGADGGFDARTGDAVLAFRKVQRMDRNFVVTPTLWRALASPKRLHPHGGRRGFHIEVDQSKQVLFTVDRGVVTAILHVSTGKPSTPTHDGTFHVQRKLAGYSPHLLYYPSYFDGNRAIHGWPDVPTYNASHGCVRVPMWAARWIYGLADLGTKVLIYHSH